MPEFGRSIVDVAKLALINKDLIVVSSKEPETRRHDTEVYTPTNRLGFETLGRVELADPSPPNLNAFEGSLRRHIRDKAVSATGYAGAAIIEQKFSRTSEPYSLDHTLGHLRHPDLYLTVGPPFFDTVLFGHLAQTAALAETSMHDTDLESNRARQAQVGRWRRRLSTSGEDWYGQLITVGEKAKHLVQTGGSFTEAFPIDGRTPINLQYPANDKGSELVIHNVNLLRQQTPDALTPMMATDDQIRQQLDAGLTLTRDVLRDPARLPALPILTKSYDVFLAYCEQMRSMVSKNGQIEALGEQQAVFDTLYSHYTS